MHYGTLQIDTNKIFMCKEMLSASKVYIFYSIKFLGIFLVFTRCLLANNSVVSGMLQSVSAKYSDSLHGFNNGQEKRLFSSVTHNNFEKNKGPSPKSLKLIELFSLEPNLSLLND